MRFLILVVLIAAYNVAAFSQNPCSGMRIRVINYSKKPLEEHRMFRNIVKVVLRKYNCLVADEDYLNTIGNIDERNKIINDLNDKDDIIALIIDFNDPGIYYEVKSNHNIEDNGFFDLPIDIEYMKSNKSKVEATVERVLYKFIQGLTHSNNETNDNECKILIGSLKVACSGGANAEGDLEKILRDEYKGYDNVRFILYKGDSDVAVDTLRQTAKDLGVDILIYSENTIKNCNSISESIYTLKSEYIGENIYIKQSSILTSNKGKIEDLRASFFSKKVINQLCWSLYNRNKNDKKYSIKLLQNIIENNEFEDERNAAFERLIQCQIVEKAEVDDIKNSQTYFINLNKKQKNSIVTLKWMHKLKSISTSLRLKSIVDESLRVGISSLFSFGKIADDFPDENYEFIFCLELLSQFKEDGNALKLINRWSKNKSSEYYIYSLEYYKNKKESGKCHQIAEEMIQKYPNLSYGYDFLCDYYFSIENYEESLKYSKLAISYYPSNPNYYIRSSKIYLKLKDFSMAETYCSIAKAINDTIVCSYLPVIDSINAIKICCNPEEFKRQKFDGKKSKLHNVKEGDTFSSIAERYGIDVEEIFKNNGISKNTTIFKGHILVIFPGCDIEKIENIPGRTFDEVVKYLKLSKLKNCNEEDIKKELIEYNGTWNQLPIRNKKNIWYIKKRCDYSKC